MMLWLTVLALELYFRLKNMHNVLFGYYCHTITNKILHIFLACQQVQRLFNYSMLIFTPFYVVLF